MSNLKLDIPELTTEDQQSLEDTLNTTIDNMTETTRVNYLKDVQAYFSKDGTIRKSSNQRKDK